MEMDIIVIIMCFELMLGVTVSALQIIYIYFICSFTLHHQHCHHASLSCLSRDDPVLLIVCKSSNQQDVIIQLLLVLLLVLLFPVLLHFVLSVVH